MSQLEFPIMRTTQFKEWLNNLYNQSYGLEKKSSNNKIEPQLNDSTILSSSSDISVSSILKESRIQRKLF